MPELLTAGGALAAAVISLVNLVVTTTVSGRRERTKWVRDSLTGAFVAFLDASWRHTDAVGERRRLAGDEAVPGPPGDAGELAARQAYDDMRSQLTRLRLLASTAVTAAGVDLVRRHGALNEAEPAELGAAISETAISRRRFIETARRAMRVG